METQHYPWISPSEIAAKADETLQEHGKCSAPIDVVNIARSLGLQVLETGFTSDDYSGAISTQEESPTIYVNEKHGYRRQRYTIAHEIGHFVLHGGGSFVDTQLDFFRKDLDSEESPSDKRAEIQANIFAAELLMPEKLLGEAYSVTPDIGRLAELFEVSEMAMRYRAANLRM